MSVQLETYTGANGRQTFQIDCRTVKIPSVNLSFGREGETFEP